MIVQYVNHSTVLSLLPDRPADSHKGNYGRILLLCGSRGYTGAVALAAMGALRTGAGLVYVGVPESIYVIESIKLTEAVVVPLKDDGGHFSELAAAEIRELLRGKDAVLVGPGLGQSTGVFSIVKEVLESFEGTLILDADGINVIQQHKDLLSERTSPTIITPHYGEFLRIASSISGDNIQDAAKLAQELGIIVLLKGHETVITDGKTTYVNQTGNPGMAVGGSGDLLSGIIVSLVGQGIAPLQAAACGAWLHGAAGDICSEEIGQYGMLPTDMLNVLPRLLK